MGSLHVEMIKPSHYGDEGHASSSTGEKHYNQARMLDASGRYGMTIFKLREALLMTPTGERDGSDK